MRHLCVLLNLRHCAMCTSSIVCSYTGVDNVVNFLLQHVRVSEHEGLDTRIWKCPRYVGIKVLYLSLFLVDEILSTCTYNEREQVEKLVSFWLLKCPLASWRWLIWRLEECSLSEAAKVIQPYAETLTGDTVGFVLGLKLYTYVHHPFAFTSINRSNIDS